MSVDVVSAAGEVRGFSNAGWRGMTVFAEAHGWRPADPDAEAFSADEMAALAAAIDGGLGDRSAAEVGEELTRLLVTPPAAGSTLFRSDPLLVEEATLTRWRDFASFARLGAARVEY